MTSEDINESEDTASKLLKRDTQHYNQLEQKYDLEKCISWINDHSFEKVCLQFPESLLNDSVDITAYIESKISRKVFILGDTAYGSCCVDEVAAKHVSGDALVHFGQACLSPVSIPVYYILPKFQLDIEKLIDCLKDHQATEPVLILYDVGYFHKIDELRKQLEEKPELSQSICLSKLSLPHQNQFYKEPACSTWCSSCKDVAKCTTTRLQRSFCLPSDGSFKSLLYIGDTNSNLNNFLRIFKGLKVMQYTDASGLQDLKTDLIDKQLSYLVERIRSAQCIGIVVATLGIQGCREAVQHAKSLCTRSGKKSYILSLGKPNPAKLANFSQIDVYITISCAEADFGDKKQYLQPMAGLFELDLALNTSRQWTTAALKDFRDVIEGGCDYVAADAVHGQKDDDLESGLELGRSLRLLPSDSSQLAPIVQHKNQWRGLDQRLGEDAASVLSAGRSGAPQSSYNSEPSK